MAMSAREFGRSWEWRVSARVLKRRKALGLTQQQLADRMTSHGAKTIVQQVSHIEQGMGVGVGKLVVLAQALECSTTYLLELTDEPDEWTPDLPLAELATPSYRSGQMSGRPPDLRLVTSAPPSPAASGAFSSLRSAKALGPKSIAPQPIADGRVTGEVQSFGGRGRILSRGRPAR